MEDFRPMFLRAVRILFAGALVAAVAVPACGNTSDSGPTPTTTAGSGGSAARGGAGGAGTSGSGGSSTAEGGAVDTAPVACGSMMCQSETLSIPGAPPLTLAACCSDAATSLCGLDTTFLSMFGPSFADPCQARDQPGSRDVACPDSTKTPVQGTPYSISFHGCCRADTGTCGYDLAKVVDIFPLGLGCVDSAPFLEGGAPLSCGGLGGAGQGGAGGETSVAGAAGETTTGGASGG
jgi:hypothetical protein